jgi:hypothetical protein
MSVGETTSPYGAKGDGSSPQTPRRDHCPSTDRPGWLWPGYHCAQDKELQRTYGITCDDYWRLFAEQEGVCARCQQPPNPNRRMVVDHDGTEILGLCHFRCNRSLDAKLRRYAADPPGRRLGLSVPADRLAKIERRYQAKRERWRRDHPSADAPSPADDYHAKVNAALEATKQGA